ncbi:MAG: hypothetical protein ACT4OY_07130 [Alphaproteobacteria bacterium]
MQYEEADDKGSFVALGIAFKFEFNAPLKVLSILNAANGRPLCYIDLDKNLADEPKTYIRLMERASQIEALKLSNNTTLDLKDTLDEDRLAAILSNVSLVARYAFDLEKEKFKRFEGHFCRDYNLAHLQIKQFSGYEPSSRFYTALLETESRNAVTARSATLPGLMNILAHKIVQELITKEMGYNFDRQSNGFISAASRLASLNLILNKSFSPARKLCGIAHIPLSSQA